MLWDFLKSRMSVYKEAVICEENSCITYSELIETTEKLSKQLLKGKVYAILCESETNVAISILACIAAQAVAVPLSYRYGNEHCRRIMSFVKPSYMLTDVSGNLQCSNTEYIEEVEKELSDVCLILCTSGTTGIPKGAMITENNIITNLLDIDEYFKISNIDKIMIVRPLYHCAVLTGEFLFSLIKGIEIHFYCKPFNPVTVVRYIFQYNITVICGTPTLFYHLFNILKRTDLKNICLHAVVISGECMCEKVAKELVEFLPQVDKYNVYGLTEASPRVSFLPPEDFEKYYMSVGKPLRSVRIRIVDRNGNMLPNGKIGELQIQGPNIMKGYYKATEITSEKLISGWLRTGDLAFLDNRGYLYIKGRKDNMIIRSGMNIYPQEIENILKESKYIHEVIAYGFKDVLIGQGIGIKVVANSNVKRSEIYQYCKEHLPEYELPNVIEIVSSLPRNASGKLVRGGKSSG